MTSERADWMISRPAFRAAMKKAFKWAFPLPDNALKALLTSPEFDEIFQENQPTPPAPFASADASLTSPVSPQDYEAENYEALANDARVQLFVNEYLAKEKERDYLRSLVVFIWKELQEGFRNWVRRLLNSPRHQESEPKGPEKPSRPVRPAPRLRNSVLKTATVAVVGVAACLLYYHPPKIEITMIAPREFPHLQIDSTPVKFDAAKVHFSDIKFQDPPEFKVAKLQFVPGSSIRLDTNASTINVAHSGTLHFDALQIKDNSVITLKFDPGILADPSKFRLNVNHQFDELLNSNSGFRVSDKSQGFFRPSHLYTWELIPKNLPPLPADKGQPKASSSPSPDNNKTSVQALVGDN